MISKEGRIFKSKMGDKELIITTNKFCENSHGSCIVSCGETVVMINVTMSEDVRPNVDFLPLNVEFQEKMYSVGKIPGGFKRREGKASDEAVVISRLIDRHLRPLFPKGFYNDVSIVATALSIDPDVSPEPLAMIGASFALLISGIPFDIPAGSVRVAIVNEDKIINPTEIEQQESRLNLIVSGTENAILMIDATANEVDEKDLLETVNFAQEEIKNLIKFQNEIKKEFDIKPLKFNIHQINKNLENDVLNFVKEKIDWILETFDKNERQIRQKQVDDEAKEFFKEKYPEQETEIGNILSNIFKEKIRSRILNSGVRPDGRQPDEIRPIWCDVGFLPRVHGSGVFTRGLTQVLTTVTLGPISESQKIDGFEEDLKRYMHQYNFPPYATGEAKSLRAPSRRDIGHGALAERALINLIPSEQDFPYAIRLVSEVLSSNGSSSMASVCASSLSLMDAGVPIKEHVAGVAMGLIKDETSKTFKILTDIQGLEDFFGDMDFKVAGTKNGITAIQMDLKIHGLDLNILKLALEKAKIARIQILEKMSSTISEHRVALSKYAPKIIAFNINPDKIRDVIGSGGKTINKIIEETGVKIDIDDDGRVYLISNSSFAVEKAKNIIMGLVENFDVGKIYSGKVVRTTNYGAFVELAPNKDGMIHISKLASHHVNKVEDIVKVGDEVEVEVLKIDEKNRIDLRLVTKL